MLLSQFRLFPWMPQKGRFAAFKSWQHPVNDDLGFVSDLLPHLNTMPSAMMHVQSHVFLEDLWCFQSLCAWRQDIWCHLWSLLTKASSNSWKRLPCLCSSHYLPPHRVIDSFFVLPCLTCWVSSSTLMTWNLFSKANLWKPLSFTHTFACGYREHSQNYHDS